MQVPQCMSHASGNSRILTGVIAVVRSYVSEATTEKERTGALAVVSTVRSLGFILGPGL